MNQETPLAERIRPKNLDEFVGQTELVGKNRPLRLAIEKKQRLNFILWGPPGVGKTTLARIYAAGLGADFFEISAVSAGKEDIRKILMADSKLQKVLFIDEIHRFNKAQQDFLLPFVEKGDLILIGATTENPSFEVIAPLLSRCRVFVLRELDGLEMATLVQRIEAVEKIKIGKNEREFLGRVANGDGRLLINLAEATLNLYGKISVATLEAALADKRLRYDKLGEEHYNTISAFIKSMRAGDPDAAVYYLARMVEAGEDPLFIARRMVVFASEDVGMAQPTALVVANEVFSACEKIGYPECAINLAHGTIYLATAKKDRRSYNALRAAQEDVKRFGNLAIPMGIRNAPTALMKELGYGKGQGGLPSELKDRKYYLVDPVS